MLHNPWFYAFIVAYLFAGFFLVALSNDDELTFDTKNIHDYLLFLFWPVYIIIFLFKG